VTAAVNIIGTDLKTGTNIVTLTGYDPTHLIRFSKPAAASSGGLLLYDAQSYWPTDAGDVPTASPVPGQIWDNTLSIYGNNGAADILLFQASGMGSPYFATEAAAFAALAAQLPVNLTGYATYKVVGLDDPHPPDNRGGLSVLVEDLGPLVGAPELDALAGGRRIGIVVRIASSPDPIRLWSGQVRDLAVPAGGPRDDGWCDLPISRHARRAAPVRRGAERRCAETGTSGLRHGDLRRDCCPRDR
jgi:hypothetical protein